MKFYCATLSHETNRFSPIPTSLTSYREFYLHLPSTGEGADVLDAPMEGVNLYAAIKRRGHETHCGLAASAQPSAPTAKADFEFLKAELISNLEKARPVDAVALFLHGAQVAEGSDDCEGEIIEQVRNVVGADIPVGVMFDLHGNVTDKMVKNADLLLACKEYPHFDFEDRAEQLIDLLEQMVRGEIRPTMQISRAPMIGTYFTTSQPMRDFVDELYQRESNGEILSASLCHGFCLADIPEATATSIVITDNDRAQARREADALSARLFEMRNAIASTTLPLKDALDAFQGATAFPVIIADITDNPGGGAPGDSTFLLCEILARGIKGAAIAMICDPQAAELATKAGVGATLPLRIGGKMGPTSGDPLDVMARVISTSTDGFQIGQGMKCPFGAAAAIDIDGVEVVLYSLRNQTFTPQCFTDFGIDPSSRRLLVVKSHQHFYEHFADMASTIIYATPPGTVDMSLKSVPSKNIARPAWPLDKPPFETFGRRWV